MRLFISVILLLLSQCASAASSCDIHAIVQHAWPDAKPTPEGVINRSNQTIYISGNLPQSAICRVWPAHPELTLAAIPLMSQKPTDYYDHTGDLELLVLNSASLEVQQRLLLPERMSDDAFRIYRISLDTARWKIAPNQTAFGLHVVRDGSSHVNPFTEDMLSLFVIEDGQLRNILKGIALVDNRGEWDGQCAGEFNDIKRTLAIDSSSHNGYANIRVREKSVVSTSYVDANGECTSKDNPAHASWILHYDGKQYRQSISK